MKSRPRGPSEQRSCQRCGQSYVVPFSLRDTSRFCSKSCKDGPRITGSCDNCRKQISFTPALPRRFCSFKCKREFNGTITQPCEGCGANVLVMRHQIGVKKYCSRRCQDGTRNIEKQCKQCGLLFRGPQSILNQSQFCSADCGSAFRTARLLDKACLQCGKRYKAWRCQEASRFCSKACVSAFLARNLRNCDHCGATFRVSIADKDTRRFCARTCQVSFHNSTKTCEQCGSDFVRCLSHSKRSRYCSYKCMGEWRSIWLRGPANPTWRGGPNTARLLLMASREYQTWRRMIFERDGYRCTRCKDKRGGNLHAHHVKYLSLYPELGLRIDNGLTLCNKCHTKVHQEHPAVTGRGHMSKLTMEIALSAMAEFAVANKPG